MKKNLPHLLYHLIVIALSAGAALSLPFTVKYVTRKMLAYWALIENEELFLMCTEIATAVVLIVLINAVVRDGRNRRLSRIAKTAGFTAFAPAGAFFARQGLKKLKEEQGFGRSVMIIGSTGFRTFAEPEGDLHRVLENCREARIMLLDPLKRGVVARAKSLNRADVTPEGLRDQVVRSIDYLKELKARQKSIRLKLYPDAPLVKLAILGDALFLKHYPTGMHVRSMPEFAIEHDTEGSLFDLFYHYFVARWLDASVPEYDLETDDLVYRDRAGQEVRREKFNDTVMEQRC